MDTVLGFALNNAIVATLLAVLVAIVARFCRRPAVSHALWLLVLMKLLTPPLIPLAVTWPRTEDAEPPPAEMSPPAVEVPSVPETAEADTANGRRQPAGEASRQPADAGRSPYSFAAVWLGGSLVWWTIAAVRLRKFQRLLRQTQPAPADVQDQAHRLTILLGLRRCPPVAFVSAPLSPLLWALGFTPRLLVPSALWQRLAAEQQDTLLAHELAHLRRGDHWVRRLEFVVLGLYWWHPVVWWARRRLQEAEEECCDALVVALLPDAAPAYAAALVETVAFLSQARAAALVGASGAGQVPLLKRRLSMILTANPSRRPSRLAFWTVLGLGALLLPLAPGAARTGAPEEPPGEKEKSPPPAVDFDRPLETTHAKPLADEMRRCASCHQPVPVHWQDWLRKPQSWKEAHDEIIRLRDELRRQQARLSDSGKRLPPVAERNHDEEIERLQDEIELLKVQAKLKQAHLEAAKADVSAAEKRWAEIESAGSAIAGSVRSKAKADVIARKAQVRIWEAELQEPLVRVKQVERRLARLQRPAERTEGGGRSQQEKRLRELEKNVDILLKEIQKLRREMQPEKPAGKNEEPRESNQSKQRMLRWSMRFNSDKGAEYVAQLHSLGAILAIPVREDSKDREYKIVEDLSARPAPLLNKDISQIQRIYWIDDKPQSVSDVLATLGIRLPRPPSHFVVFMLRELEQKLFRLEKSYLDKHHPGRTENDILETTFRLNRSGSNFKPEVVAQTVR